MFVTSLSFKAFSGALRSFLILCALGCLFTTQGVAADFNTGYAYKITALYVERSFDNGSQTTSALMEENLVEPEISLEFLKGDTDGLGLGFRVGGSQFKLTKQVVQFSAAENNTSVVPPVEIVEMGNRVSGTYTYAVIPAFYRYEVPSNNFGLEGIIGEVFYGTGQTQISGEIYLTKNCPATVISGVYNKTEAVSKVKAQCEKATLDSNKSTTFQGVQAELQGSSYSVLIRSLGPKFTDNGGGVEKDVILGELSLIISYKF